MKIQQDDETSSDWEYVDPIVDESRFSDSFDKEFLKSDTWKHLLRCYPNSYEEHYMRWKKRFKNRQPTRTDIGVFQWQIIHHYLPKLSV